MNWQDRRVVVTGGAGFIGSHLVDRLVDEGAHVTVIDNLSTGRRHNLDRVRDDVEFIQGSTLEAMRLKPAFRDVDVVFHLAAVLGVRRTWEEPVRVIHENVRGTENVLREAAHAGADRVVLASSSEVYGDGEPPYSETTTPAAPETGYAAAKLLEEKLAGAYHEETGLKTACMRYFNTYGPRQESSDYGFVTAIFCDRVRHGRAPVIFGDGEQTRDFTFVGDTVDATLRAAERADDHDVLNVGTGVETTVNTLARRVLDAGDHRDVEPEHAPPRRDEVQRRLADATRAKDVLGWDPRWELEDGLRETLRALPRVPRPAEPLHAA